MHNLLNESYAVHNSLDDVKALQKLSQLVLSKFPSYIFDSTIHYQFSKCCEKQVNIAAIVGSKSC